MKLSWKFENLREHISFLLEKKRCIKGKRRKFELEKEDEKHHRYRFVRSNKHFCIPQLLLYNWKSYSRLTIVNKRSKNMVDEEEEEEEVADVRRHFNGTSLIFGITPEEPSFSTSGVCLGRDGG